MADLPEYKRFSIYSKKDPSSGAYAISDYEKDRRNFINNALKSALPEGAYVQVSSKSLAKTGQERIDIYVHKEDANLVGKSLSGLGEQMKHKGSIEEKYHVTKARPVDEDQSKALYADEKARAKALENEQKESYRFNKGSLIKIFSTLLAIANIARRILTATLNNASQSAKDMVTAHNLGLSYRTVREARFTEEALGVREGVITEGITDVQTAFGNITKLDEKTLEDLAVVMGSQT